VLLLLLMLLLLSGFTACNACKHDSGEQVLCSAAAFLDVYITVGTSSSYNKTRACTRQ
jgi:hypothetical protein